MDTLVYIVPWVLTSVLVGVVAGYFLRRGRADGSTVAAAERAEQERQATLKVLVEVLKSVEQINGDVESHNSEIRQTADHVGSMKVSGEMVSVQQVLLDHMKALATSNKRLQNDLLSSRYHMEEQAREIDQIRQEAYIDALAHVANRKAFDEKLHLLLAAWNRQRQPFVLIMADMDHLKRINDSHGHRAGDMVIQRVGAMLKETVREGDLVARYGGDEFAVLLPNTVQADGANLAEAIRGKAADQGSQVTYRGEEVALSLSIGVAAVADGDDAGSIIQRADTALYRSKHLGRNQVQIEHPRAASPSAAAPEIAPLEADPAGIPALEIVSAPCCAANSG
jgi:diguanylate cyclase